MLTPAKDDKNYKQEMERKKTDPKAFGVHASSTIPTHPGSNNLVTDMTHWARECVKHNKQEIAAMLPKCTREHITVLIAVETRKDVLALLNEALTSK